MSFLHTVTLTSFHALNPDWEIKVYNHIFPNEPDYAPKYTHYTGNDFLPEVRTWDWVSITDVVLDKSNIHSILISDKWRRETLYENGGVYSDFDVIWLKPIEHLKNIEYIGDIENFTSVVSYYQMKYGFHNVSILISEKESPFDKEIIEGQARVTDLRDDQAFGTTLLNRMYPTLFTIPYPVLAVPYETFYPYSTYNLKQLFEEDDLSPITNNTLAVHWFNGNPISKAFINNPSDKECSINSILKWLHL